MGTPEEPSETPPSDTWQVIIPNPEEFHDIDRLRWGGKGAQIKRRFERLPSEKQRPALVRFLKDCDFDEDGFHLRNCVGLEVSLYVLEERSAVVVVSINDSDAPLQ